MEFKLFREIPEHVGPEWHKGRAVADHINEPAQRERLLETLDLISSLLVLDSSLTVADWGAGNGGLLHEIKGLFPSVRAWGYDLMPSNIDYAKTVYGVTVNKLDIVTERPEAGDIVVVTEVLEHLVSPHSLLLELHKQKPRYVFASSPAFENPENHYEFHLWAWTAGSYVEMFERANYRVLRHFVTAYNGTQFIVAEPKG